MKLKELFEQKLNRIFHSTEISFKKFKARPTWFSLNEKDAYGWHDNGHANHDKQVTLICSYEGTKIASIKQAEVVAKKIWPDDEFIYSMFDVSVGEFPQSVIKEFIKALEEASFEAAYIDDYDPNNYDGNSNSISLCVFNPADTVSIIGELKKTGDYSEDYDIPKRQRRASEFSVGEKIYFKDDGLKPREGTIFKIVKKGEKIPRVDGIDYSRKHEDDHPGKAEYDDTLYVRTENNRVYDVTLHPHIHIGKLKE